MSVNGPGVLDANRTDRTSWPPPAQHADVIEPSEGEPHAPRAYAVRVPLDGAFSPLHWLIVSVVALLVLGPEQLPKLARRAGHAYSEFARVRTHLASELRDMVSEFDLGAADGPNKSPNMLPPMDVPASGGLREGSE